MITVRLNIFHIPSADNVQVMPFADRMEIGNPGTGDIERLSRVNFLCRMTALLRLASY